MKKLTQNETESSPAAPTVVPTPTPWTYLKRPRLCHVESAMDAVRAGEPVCSIPIAREQDAAFIVEACNAHASLLAENARLTKALKRLLGAYRADYENDPNMTVLCSYRTNGEAIDEAKSALAGKGAS